jgi:hypothetical protein
MLIGALRIITGTPRKKEYKKDSRYWDQYFYLARRKQHIRFHIEALKIFTSNWMISYSYFGKEYALPFFGFLSAPTSHRKSAAPSELPRYHEIASHP